MPVYRAVAQTVVRCVLAVLLLLVGNCDDSPPYYKCFDDRECLDLNRHRGRCLTSQYGPFCAFPDADCATMWRWDQISHPEIKNECVAPSVPLDAAVDASVDMSPPQEGD